MIWYLLYPIRRTTEAPVLAPTHLIRRACTRYGRYVARHVATVLLLAVAAAIALVYPFPFLYTRDFVNGASNLPHHVWTDAQPLRAHVGFEPDVIMRTVWVHGSYMRVLDKEVLLGALELQDGLLGPTKDFNPRQPAERVSTAGSVDIGAISGLNPEDRDSFHVVNGLTNRSWFFHSPLQYWSGDVVKIQEDQDIISTVNAKKTQSTSVNVTLRHSIVFSGKRFEDRKLVAADALVITLVHLRDSPVGRLWVQRAEELASRMADRWTAYPADGKSMPSQLYEFQFRPMSFLDYLTASIAYLCTFVYFFYRMSKLHAVKSKAGLIITVLVQFVVCILSSFTLCAVFRIDLSRIPQAGYPIVVWAMSLENMFRLINAVILTPPEASTRARVGQAYGETAHIAIATLAQYLFILLALSRVVVPGVSAFCAFAAIATVFDFFYLSTFFLSVLSIEVRRTELSDALEGSSHKQKRRASDALARQSWVEAVLQGRLALSTRIAGIIVMLGFVMIAQWHFFTSDGMLRTLGSMFIPRRGATDLSKSSLLVDVNQARSPTSWLRMQDHETAREVIQVVKPWSHSYVARVYDPLVFVLKGSNRTPPARERTLPPAVYDFIHHQTLPLISTIVLLVLLVRLLIKFLLWDEIVGGNRSTDDEPLVSVKTISCGHVLDVAMMCATPDGRVVSAGLDRIIWVWDVRFLGTSYIVTNPDSVDSPFPVLAMAIDDDSRWLALLSTSKVRIWDLVKRVWGPSVELDLQSQKTEAFFYSTRAKEASLSIVMIGRSGIMSELWPASGRSESYVVCKSPLSCAVPLASRPASSQATSFVTLSRRGCIHKATAMGTQWVSEEVRLPSEEKDIQSVLPVPAFSSYLVVRVFSVDLVDFNSSTIIHSFRMEGIVPRSLAFFHSHPRKTQCGARGLSSFTLVYVKAEGGDCVIQTYLPTEEGGAITFRDNSSLLSGGGGCTWRDATEVKRRVESPGLWAALPSGCVVGIRQPPPPPQQQQPSSLEEQQQQQLLLQSSPTGNTLRRRRPTPPHHQPNSGIGGSSLSSSASSASSSTSSSARPDGAYEVWTMTQLEKRGDFETRPLADVGGDDGGDEEWHLYHSGGGSGGGSNAASSGVSTTVTSASACSRLMVSEPGPMVKVGVGSVAVAFGNIIKIVTVGHEGFGGRGGFFDADDEGGILIMANRRRKAAGAGRNRASAGAVAGASASASAKMA